MKTNLICFKFVMIIICPIDKMADNYETETFHWPCSSLNSVVFIILFDPIGEKSKTTWSWCEFYDDYAGSGVTTAFDI